MGVCSHGEEGWVKLGENERKRRTANPINRNWDTEQEYNRQQTTRGTGR